MLSVTLHDTATCFRFHLEGELVAESVAELEGSWRTASSTFGERGFVVDLGTVSNIDDAGEALLRQMHREGGEFLARSDYQRTLIREITGDSGHVSRPARKTMVRWILEGILR